MTASNTDPQHLYLTSSTSTSTTPFRNLSESSSANPNADALIRQENKIYQLESEISAIKAEAEKTSAMLEALQNEKDLHRKISESYSRTMDLIFWVVVFLSIALSLLGIYGIVSLLKPDLFSSISQWISILFSAIGIGTLWAFCKWLYGLSKINKRVEQLESSSNPKKP